MSFGLVNGVSKDLAKAVALLMTTTSAILKQRASLLFIDHYDGSAPNLLRRQRLARVQTLIVCWSQ